MIEAKSKYVIFLGIRKYRMRCPQCGRAAPDEFCIVHGDIKAVDLTEDLKVQDKVKEIIKWQGIAY